MANIYRPDDNREGADVGSLPVPGHEDHDHTVTVISGNDLPDEVKESLIDAIMNLADGDSIPTLEQDDPNPLTDEENTQLITGFTMVAHMLTNGVLTIQKGLDSSHPQSPLTREEAVDGLERAIKYLGERRLALTLEAPENEPQDA